MTHSANSSTNRYLSAEDRWRAVTDRDAAAEGCFVYAVTTTGIYCRPTCPSRRPRRGNATFFDHPVEAESAGFRACKRCRPNDVSSTQRLVARVQASLDAAETAPTLAELAKEVGVSPFHLQRVFKKATGLSPKQYALARREERLQKNLEDGKSVTTAMYDAGFESSHALYRTARRRLGMRPKTYQQGGQGETLRYGLFPNALGTLLVAATDAGLVSVTLGHPDEQVQDLKQAFPAACLNEDAEAVEPYRQQIEAFLTNDQSRFDLPLDLRGTDFQRRVWGVLRTIPRGETRSYSDIAQLIGQPKAVRAVARACATNPVALIVPCHRVVMASGKLGGYRWGVETKKQLLEQENS